MESKILTIATATITASSTAPLSNQTSIWFTYGVDIALVVIFLIVYFFLKPETTSTRELIEEQPNELEKILATDPAEEKEEDIN